MPKKKPEIKKTELEPLYSIPGAAQYLNVSRHTISAWLRDGKLRRTHVGRRVVIRASQLLRVIKDEG